MVLIVTKYNLTKYSFIVVWSHIHSCSSFRYLMIILAPVFWSLFRIPATFNPNQLAHSLALPPLSSLWICQNLAPLPLVNLHLGSWHRPHHPLLPSYSAMAVREPWNFKFSLKSLVGHKKSDTILFHKTCIKYCRTTNCLAWILATLLRQSISRRPESWILSVVFVISSPNCILSDSQALLLGPATPLCLAFAPFQCTEANARYKTKTGTGKWQIYDLARTNLGVSIKCWVRGAKGPREWENMDFNSNIHFLIKFSEELHVRCGTTQPFPTIAEPLM